MTSIDPNSFVVIDRLDETTENIRRIIVQNDAQLENVLMALDEDPGNRVLEAEREELIRLLTRDRAALGRAKSAKQNLRTQIESQVLDLTLDSDDNDAGPLPTDGSNRFERITPLRTKVEESPVVAIAPQEPVQPTALFASDIQVTVARHELLIQANDVRESALHGAVPALFRPALDESLWAETAQLSQSKLVARVDPNLAATATIDDAARAEGATADATWTRLKDAHDSHIALIHETVSPLVNDASTTYDQGDEFGISDTISFAREKPTSQAATPGEWRDYMHRFTFSPNRYDYAMSIQAIATAKSPIESLALRPYEIDESFRTYQLNRTTSNVLAQRLVAALENTSSQFPDVYNSLDASLSRNRVNAPRSAVLYVSTDIQNDDIIKVDRYRWLESAGNFLFSHKLVLESTKRSDFRSTDRQQVAATSLFPEELIIQDTSKPVSTSSSDVDIDPVVATNQYERLVALADIERALAEYDGDELGILRTQSLNRSTAGPFYVIDRLREYKPSDPMDSLAAQFESQLSIADILERRLQRHQQQRIRATQRTPMPFNAQLARDGSAELDDGGKFAAHVVRELTVDAAEPVAVDRDGKPETTAVLQQIEDEDEVRSESRKRVKRRLVRRGADSDEESTPLPSSSPPPLRPLLQEQDSLPAGFDRDQPEEYFVMDTDARALHHHFDLVHSAAKRKERSTSDSVTKTDDDDEVVDDELEEKSEEDEPEGEDLDKEETYEDEFDEELALGAHVVRQSPAIFESSEFGGYRAPVLGVPMSATPIKLLTAIAAAGGWRRAARLILLAAVYYKLVPELYSAEFPTEAVEWLVGTLRLLRERVGVAHALYNANVTSALAKVLKLDRERIALLRSRAAIAQKRMPNNRDLDENRLPETVVGLEQLLDFNKIKYPAQTREALLDAAGVNTAVLPIVLVVETDESIGQLVASTAKNNDFSANDRMTAALIYATQQRRPLGDLITTEAFDRSTGAADLSIAAESYPTFDTYAANGAAVADMFRVLGPIRAAALRDVFEWSLSEGSVVARRYNELTLDNAAVLARAIFTQIERGERNDIEFVYLPLPRDNDAGTGVAASYIDRAVSMYMTLHNSNGALDTRRVIDLAVARVRDSRQAAVQVLVGECAAYTYTAAAQQYVNENFPPHDRRAHTVFTRETAVPFGVYDSLEQLNVVETERALLSRDWLGRGRIAADSLGSTVKQRKRVPFFKLMQPSTLALWCFQTAPLVQQQEQLALLISNAYKFINRLVNESKTSGESIHVFMDRYNGMTQILERELAALGLTAEEMTDLQSDVSTSDFINSTGAAIVAGKVSVVNIDLLSGRLRTTIPFPRFGCGDDVVGEQNESKLAEVWYSTAQQLNWFSLGYLGVPFSTPFKMPLKSPESAGADERYSTFAHVFAQLDDLRPRDEHANRIAELQFLIAREVSTVHMGRTLWFEETTMHNNPTRFGELVRAELATLVQWVKTKQQIVGIDYRGTLPEAALLLEALRVKVDPGTVSDAADIRTLDMRNTSLVTNARALAIGTEKAAVNGVNIAVPFANHKQLSSDQLLMAQELYAIGFDGSNKFPQRVYTDDKVRNKDVAVLLTYTKKLAALSDSKLATFEAALADNQKSNRVPDSWRQDKAFVQASMRADRERRRGNSGAALVALRKLLFDKLRRAVSGVGDQRFTLGRFASEAEVKSLSALIQHRLNRRDALLADFTELIVLLKKRTDVYDLGAQLDTLRVDDVELRAAMETVARKVLQEQSTVSAMSDSLQREMQEDPVFRGNLSASFRPVQKAAAKYLSTFDADESDVRSIYNARRDANALAKSTYDALSDYLEFANDKYTDVRDVALRRLTAQLTTLRNAIRALIPDDDNVEANDESQTVDEILSLTLASFRALKSYDDFKSDEKGFGAEAKQIENLRASLRVFDAAVRTFAELLENVNRAAESNGDDDAAGLPDPNVFRDVLVQMIERYESDIDGVRFNFMITTMGRGVNDNFGTQIGTIPRVFTSLLLPAAIERARLRLSIQQAGEQAQLSLSPALLVSAGDVPQALRVAELVRRYALFGQVPIDGNETNVFEEYAALLDMQAENSADGQWSVPLLESSLYQERPPAVERDRDDVVLQHYSLGTGIHHRVGFGADLQLSALWVRLMRFYLQYQRKRSARKELVSLTSLYEASQTLPYRRELNRTIAEMPLASDRCRAYLALIFGDLEDAVVDVVPGMSSAIWRTRGATVFFPLIEEMRAIDARLLVSLISGFDYSPLRRRERRDPFNPERFDQETGALNDNDGVLSDDDLNDDTIEDDAQLQNDGRDAVQRLDTRYIYRRSIAAKEVLVDAYYRMMIEEMYAVRAADVETLAERAREKGTAEPQRSQLAILYQVIRGVKGAIVQPEDTVYANFIGIGYQGIEFAAPVIFEGVPVRRLVVVARAIDALQMTTEGKSLIGKTEMLQIYQRLIRDARFDVRRVADETDSKRETLRRSTTFVTSAVLNDVSPGAQAHALSERGEAGYNATERSLLAAAVRYRFYEQTNSSGPVRVGPPSVISQTHKELAWHLVTRSALVAGMQTMAFRSKKMHTIYFAALETLSKKLDAATHLWHDDVPANEEPRRDLRSWREIGELTQEEEPIGIAPPPVDDVEETPLAPVVIEAVEPLVVLVETPPQSTVEPVVPVLGIAAIEASNNIDVAGWRTHVERSIGRLLLGTAASSANADAVARLDGSIEPPKIRSQELLLYETKQLSGSDADGTALLELLTSQMRRVIPWLRELFERLDPGGNSELFNEGSLTSQRDEILAAVPVEDASLFWLLARTEARRRARWHPLAEAGEAIRDSDVARIVSLTKDVEPGVSTYAYFSSLFYQAIEKSLLHQSSTLTTPKRIIENYASTSAPDAQRRAAFYFVSRQAALALQKTHVTVKREDLEKYVPVDVLLDSLFFGGNIIRTNQYHPLVPLLVSAASRKPMIRLRSFDQNNTTVTALAGPIFTNQFTPSDASVLASSDVGEFVLLHEFVPSLTKPKAKINYTIVNRIAVGSLGVSTLDELVNRIVSTRLDGGANVPMIRYKK